MRAFYGIGLALAAVIIGALCAGLLEAPDALPGKEDADYVDRERRIISLRWLGRLLRRD